MFRVSYPGRTMIMMAGLEANRLFALEGERVFSASRTYARVSRELGSESYPNAHDGDRHRELRRLLAPSLSAMAIEPFLGRLFELIRARSASWRPGAVYSASDAVSDLVTDLVAVCTTNRTVGRRLSRDIDFWATMMGAVGVGGVLPEFTLYLPPVRAARRRLAGFLEQALSEHRTQGASLERPPDVLDALLTAASQQPDRVGPAALLTLAMIPIKNAGIYLYRLVSFVLYELLRRRDLLEAVTAEADAAFAGGEPTLEHVRGMRTLQGVILGPALHPWRSRCRGSRPGGVRVRRLPVSPRGTGLHRRSRDPFRPALFPDPRRLRTPSATRCGAASIGGRTCSRPSVSVPMPAPPGAIRRRSRQRWWPASCAASGCAWSPRDTS